MVWARFEVIGKASLHVGSPDERTIFAANGLGPSQDDKSRELVFNMNHVVYWTGGGADHCLLALSNGEFVKVKATDSLLEVLTGTSPHILRSTFDSTRATKSQT